MTSLRNGTYYISVLLSPPGFLQVDADGNAPVVRRFTGSTLQQWRLVLRNSSIYSIQNVQFLTYVSMFDATGTNGTPLTSSTTEVTWYFRLVGGSYTISHCSCLRNGWKVDLMDSVPTLAPFESTYQGELWNITTTESSAQSQSPPPFVTSTAKISNTPSPFPNQATSTAVRQTNMVPLTVGLGVGLGVPAIIAIVVLVIYFANRNKPRGKPINPAFDPSLSSMSTSRERK